MNYLKFSGHDTFHCRQQWLFKGIELIDNEDLKGFQSLESSILNLGVGKNMVQSIQYWLRAFGLIDEEKKKTNLAELIFSKKHEGKKEVFMEDYLEKFITDNMQLDMKNL